MWCKHDWKVLHSETHKSPLERMGVTRIKSAPYEWKTTFLGTSIIICSCSKCGKLTKFTEKV